MTVPGCDTETVVGTDLENAYGRAYRSSCPRGCRQRVPRLAVLAATQWSAGGTLVWQRSGGTWRSSHTQRGGWQGSRLMQLMFAFGLEDCYDAVPAFGNGSVARRVGLQDDTYLFGPAAGIAATWEVLRNALAAGGHRLCDHKCKAWSPLCDHLPDNQL